MSVVCRCGGRAGKEEADENNTGATVPCGKQESHVTPLKRTHRPPLIGAFWPHLPLLYIMLRCGREQLEWQKAAHSEPHAHRLMTKFADLGSKFQPRRGKRDAHLENI